MKKVAFLGSKKIGYECLKLAIDHSGIDVVAVLTAAANPLDGQETVADLCKENEIPVLPSLQELADKDIDILISVQYHEILKKRHIELAKDVAVNLHMAPLPEYRGCNQFSFAIIDQKREFGTTLHRLEEGIDSGDILLEKRFPVPQECFVQDLYQLTFEHSVDLFRHALPQLVNGDFEGIDQASLENIRGSSYHFRKDIDSIKQIDHAWDIEKQKRHFRATWFPPFPPPYALIDGKKVELDMDWYESL
jgi:methionyl-tRNA formyltransferase